LQEDLKKQSAQRQSLSSQLAGAKRELAKLQAEREGIDAQRAASDKDNEALKARVLALEQQLTLSQRELEARAQSINRLTALVGASAQALSNAETKNRQLYAAGMKAVDAYRSKGFGDVAAQREPVFGLRAVDLENAAEGLRSQLDAERLPTTPAGPPAATQR
jgi:chromosome segregation ATPase